ncbi:MAG: hypothetical protein AAGD00_06025 [Planctomycetota bacterium]
MDARIAVAAVASLASPTWSDAVAVPARAPSEIRERVSTILAASETTSRVVRKSDPIAARDWNPFSLAIDGSLRLCTRVAGSPIAFDTLDVYRPLGASWSLEMSSSLTIARRADVIASPRRTPSLAELVAMDAIADGFAESDGF